LIGFREFLSGSLSERLDLVAERSEHILQVTRILEWQIAADSSLAYLIK
jgi:hypothetical protein